MPLYNYKGYESKSGKPAKGKVEADSPKAARQKLKLKSGIIVAEIKEETSLDNVKKGKLSFGSSGNVSLQDLSIMSRQFATLQSAHVPLDESLKALSAQVENTVLRNTLSAVKDQVSEGKSLAEASASFPGVFNNLYVNMVKAGESSGTLGLVLERLADTFEYQMKIRGQVVQAMTYPLVMIGVSMLIIAYLFVSVVPKLTKVFTSMRVTIPWYTSMIVSISNFLQSYWYVLVGGAVFAAYLFRRWLATPKGRRKFDELALQAPVFGAVVIRINISRFTRTLSTLLNSGVPIIQALDITKNVITNTLISEVMDLAKTAVQEGQNLGDVIERSGRFPPLVCHMIKTGEKTGQLEEMLAHVATAYDAEVERKIGSMIALIEPAMIVVMFGIVGTIAIAMLMPMFSVMSQIR